MKYVIYSGLICCCLFYTATFAQENKEIKETGDPSGANAISLAVHPLYLFNKAVKIDAEWQTKKPLAFILGGELYTGKINGLYKQRDNDGERLNDKISGLGVNFAFKYKFKETGALSSFYISPGVTYRHLNLKLNGPMFYSYMENDIEYYTYGQAEKILTIDPVAFYGNIGRYIEVNSFVLDMYFGLGYKTLKQNAVLKASREFDNAMYGYNYEGYIFQIGLKIGWQITK